MRKSKRSNRRVGPRFSRRTGGLRRGGRTFTMGKGRKSVFLGGTRLGLPARPGRSLWSAIKECLKG